jgi:hypothetical protein
MKILDRNDSFFAKPWRKWATILVPMCWGLYELAFVSAGWGFVFFSAGCYAAWELILRPPKDSE